jgi:DNA primase
MPELTQVLDRYNITWKPAGFSGKIRNGWIGVDCPMCSPGWGKYRLGFEVTTGRTSCWVCGLQYGPKIFAQLFRVKIGEATKIWHSIPKDRQRVIHYDLPESTGKYLPPAGRGPLLPQHRKYLEKRGFDPDELVNLWSIEGIGMAADFGWRIFIPIFDFYGRPISWTTRSIAPNAELRYRSAKPEQELFSMKSVLFGAHLASHVAIISEGPMDAFAWGPGGLATLGVGYSQAQLAAMTQYPVRAVCFDNEPAAQKRADKLCEELAAFPGSTQNIVLETGDDPAEAEREEISEVRQSLGLD